MAPKLNLDGLTDIRVKVGQPIRLGITYEGEPPPTAVWSRDGATLTSNEHIEVTSQEHRSDVEISSSVRSDGGRYTITVTNEFGTDFASCNVVVLGPPSAPKGPLKASDIHAEGCTLNWKPPEDDGGAQLSHYV